MTGHPASLGAALDGALPKGRFNPDPDRTPEEWAAHDLEEKRIGSEESRQYQIESRLETLRSRRPADFAENHPPADPAAREKLAGWVARLGAGEYPGVLWLGGIHGAGKTNCIWDTAEAAIRAGFPGQPLVANAGDLWEVFSPPVDVDARRRLATVPLLALDDLGRLGTSGWEKGHLWWVIDQRVQQHRPTIITSNKDLETEDVVDAATLSRLQQGWTAVWLGWVDHRTGIDWEGRV